MAFSKNKGLGISSGGGPSTGFEQEVTVAKSGGDFTSVQAAIDSITDAADDKRYLVSIYPGEYTEDIVGKSYVRLNGQDPFVCTILDGSYACGVNASGLSNLRFKNTLSADKTIITATAGSGIPTSRVSFQTVFFEISNNIDGIKPTVFDVDMATFVLQGFAITYVDQATGASSDTNIIDINGATRAIITSGIGTIFSGRASGDINFILTNSSVSTQLTSLPINMTMLNPAYSGTCGALKSVNSGVCELGLASCVISGAGSGTGAAIIADSGASVIEALETVITVSNFTTNCYSDAVNVGDIITLPFCVLKGSNVKCGLGAIAKMTVEDGDVHLNTALIDENIPLNGATNRSFQDLINIGFSAGWSDGNVVTNNGDGTVDVTDGKGIIRTANNDQAPLRTFDVPGVTNLVMIDQVNNIIYIDYNAGSPIIKTTTALSSIFDNENDKYEVSVGFRDDLKTHITPLIQRSKNVTSLLQQRLNSIQRIVRANAEGGLILGESADGSQFVTLEAGSIWAKVNKIAIPSFDTAIASTFDRYYQNPASTWIKTTGNTTWDALQYNDPALGLVAVGVAKFSFQDFWSDTDGELLSVYAVADYNSQAGAEFANQVMAPPRAELHSFYVGRIVFAQNVNIALDVLSPFTGQVITGTAVTAHNDTTGKQGGTSGEFYHLTSSAYNNLLSQDQSVTTTSDVTFASAVIPVVTDIKVAAYDVVIGDESKIIQFDNAAVSFTTTIPLNASEAFNLGTIIQFRKTGAGDITIAKAVGVTFRGVLGNNNVKIDGEDGYLVQLEKTGTDTWLISGNIKGV